MFQAPKSSEVLQQAFDHCSRVTREHYENFPVGSFLLPARIRPHVYAIYAFARTADDFADEPGMDPGERLARLEDWRRRLHLCLEEPEGLVFTALAETIRLHSIPLGLLDDLLTAFRQDVIVQRHETFVDLLAYCRYSAVPVGRLILHLFGYRDPERLAYSDAICSALQLANFWQDVAIDFARDRVYLPQEDMRTYGVTEDDLRAGRVSAGLQSLLALEAERTEDLFRKGSPLPERVSGRLKYELRLTCLGGMEILRKLERSGYDVFDHRPTVTRPRFLSLLLRSLFPLRLRDTTPAVAGHSGGSPGIDS
jgi:squalene synthase HpnC